MKHETFLAQTGRAICALGAFALIAGTSAAFAQTHTMDKKHSTMPGMAAGGDMQGHMKGMMKMHHQGAIDMAQMELQSGKDAKMRAMAKRIIKDQQKEIKELDQWLGKRK